VRKILLFLIISLWIFPLSHALTLTQIRTEIRLRIKDSSTLRQRYTDTQINNIINQEQRDIVNISWIIKKSTTIPLAVGSTYYTLPTDTIAIHRIMLDNANLPETTLQELDSRFNFTAWPLSYGKPDHYFQDPSRSTQIGVYPWPNNSTSTGTLSIIYFSQGSDLSSDSDTPFNSETRYYPYHDLLIYGACYKIFSIEGEFDKSNEYKAYYESRLQILLAAIGNKPNFLPGFSGQRR